MDRSGVTAVGYGTLAAFVGLTPVIAPAASASRAPSPDFKSIFGSAAAGTAG